MSSVLYKKIGKLDIILIKDKNNCLWTYFVFLKEFSLVPCLGF